MDYTLKNKDIKAFKFGYEDVPDCVYSSKNKTEIVDNKHFHIIVSEEVTKIVAFGDYVILTDKNELLSCDHTLFVAIAHPKVKVDILTDTKNYCVDSGALNRLYNDAEDKEEKYKWLKKFMVVNAKISSLKEYIKVNEDGEIVLK